MTTDTQQIVPRIYVASLSDYNAGKLHGRWIVATQSAEAIHAEVAAMLRESREPIAEEWAIHDYEGFHGLSLREFESLEYVAEAATLIKEHGPVFASLLDRSADIAEAKRYMEEGYRGAFEKLEHYVQELVEDCYADLLKPLPDFILYNIDYAGIAHDFECGGDIFTIVCNHEVHVFDAHI
jgi:antirestriction protein